MTGLDVKRIRALCFDVDGTLSDTDDQWVGRIAGLLKPMRRFLKNRDPIPPARRLVMGMASPGNLLYNLLDRVGLDDEVGRLVSALSRRGMGRQPKTFWIIPDVVAPLALLREYYPMAIVSARGESSTQAFLKQFELQKFFEVVVTAQTCVYTKPFPDPILFAAEKMGVQPQECLMIGDTTVDIRAGKAAGAQTVGVLCGFGNERELLRAGADLILPSPAVLQEALLPSLRTEDNG